MTDDLPTPEQLAARVAAFAPESLTADAEMADIIRAAETGGAVHMNAVIDALFAVPTPPPGPRPDDLIVGPDRQTRYRADDMNVWLELRFTLDGRQCQVRTSVDPFLFERRFADDDSEFERYIDYFLRNNFGRMAADPEMARHLRERLWIVRPSDAHDTRTCRRTHEDGEGVVWPRCLHGAVVSELPGIVPVPGAGAPGRSDHVLAFGPPVRRESVLGACACRCHRADPRYLPPGLAPYSEPW